MDARFKSPPYDKIKGCGYVRDPYTMRLTLA